MSKDIVRWADKAQYLSQPIESDKPTVHLLSMTPDPLGSIAAASKMYKGEITNDLSDITDEERKSFFEDGTKTVLGAPFETVDFHFLISGVTRAFTHQLVRQRTAVYFQESMRFAVVDDRFADRVALPPSLEGTQPWSDFAFEMQQAGLDPIVNANHKQRQRKRWDEALGFVEDTYKDLVNDDMPAEDARGLLPTNIKTRVQYKTNLRNLIDHAGMRLCTQAQFEWRYVFTQISEAIRNADINTGDFKAPVHMADMISDKLFRPVCYKLGHCGFKASFDRHCTIKDRVEANANFGRPSSEWGGTLLIGEPTDYGNEIVEWVDGVGYNSEGNIVRINSINDNEWKLDPAAARS